MIFEIIVLPIIAGLLIATTVGPIGCFVVWQRMTFFGDTLAHSTLLGIAFSLFFSLPVEVGSLSICLILSLILFLLKRNSLIPTDTLLGILSHSSLALGIVAIHLTDLPVNVSALLFGDILSVGVSDLVWIALVACTSLTALFLHWRDLITVSINRDIASSQGVKTFRIELLLTLIIGLVVAIGIKIVGSLLLTALMIIPAATARYYAKTPELMAIISTAIASGSVIIGIMLSYWIDIPTGPSIVINCFFCFIAAKAHRLFSQRYAS